MHYHRKSSFSIRGLEERVTVPQVGAPGKLFFLQTRHILQWSHTALASKWTSFDGAANKATVFCCCANTFLSFFIWPPANYTCYFCLGNLLSWKRKYETTFQRKPLKLFGWQHQSHQLQKYHHKAFSDQMEILRVGENPS